MIKRFPWCSLYARSKVFNCNKTIRNHKRRNKVIFKRLLSIFLITSSLNLWAQMPIGHLPTQYNGGFAGEAGAPRLFFNSYMTGYRQGGYVPMYGSYLSYDNFFRKLRSGISFTLGRTNSNYYFAKTDGYSASVSISPKFSFNGKYTLAPFVTYSLAGSISKFATSPNGSSPELDEAKSLGGNVRAGALLNSSKWYVGLTIASRFFQHNLYRNFEPSNTGYYYGVPKIRVSIQAGYTFQRTPESKFSFTPQITLTPFRYRFTSSSTLRPTNATITQTTSDSGISAVMNLMFRYRKIIAGVNNGFRIDEDVLERWKDPDIILGYQTKHFRVLLNQNISKYVYEGQLGIRYTMKSRTNNGPVAFD
jgi:hypothetical protein